MAKSYDLFFINLLRNTRPPFCYSNLSYKCIMTVDFLLFYSKLQHKKKETKKETKPSRRSDIVDSDVNDNDAGLLRLLKK